ncbi:MAG: sulfur carrier protein ThiS [Candidatus Fibromonas sp.]|nr:sulfur carrier protein ThiS [Candidatus Fibromonas sp.]
MKLSINGEIAETNFNTVGEWAIAEFKNFTGKGLAIAVNDCVVPNSEWNLRFLQDGDRILVVQATQGG